MLAGAATASVWDFESSISQQRQSLRAASDSAGSEVRYLTQLALETDKIPLLKRQVDLGVSGASDAADRARFLDTRCSGAYAEAERAMRGTSRRAAPDRALAAQTSALSDANSTWQRTNGDFVALGSRGNDSTRQQAQDALTGARQALDRVDGRLKTMRDDLDKLQSRYRQLGALQDDIERAAQAVADAAASMQSEAAPTKARIGAIGTPPENESRTAASQKIDDFRAPLNSLALGASTILNRTDDFTRHWMTFEKAREDFEPAADGNDADLFEARRQLDAARVLVQQLQSQAASQQTNQ